MDAHDQVADSMSGFLDDNGRQSRKEARWDAQQQQKLLIAQMRFTPFMETLYPFVDFLVCHDTFVFWPLK